MINAIGKVAVLALAMIVTLAAHLTYIVVTRSDELNDHAFNTRKLLDEYSRPRGSIFAGDTVLARSVETTAHMRFQRQYPNNAIAMAPIIGYYSRQFSVAGLEANKHSFLTGTADELRSRQSWFSTEEALGGNIELTINPVLQQRAHDELAAGRFTGSIALVQPSSGRVLALGSTPSYEPNFLVSPDADVRQREMDIITANADKPLLNHATQQPLPPGSIFKLVTTLAALRNGYQTNSPVTGAATITLPGTNVQLSNYGGSRCGSGQTTLAIAFRLSCNTAFVQISTEVGVDAFTSAAADFGVDGNQDGGFPLEYLASTTGAINNDAQLGQSSIGQRDVRMTTLAAAMMAATVANGGVRMKPQIIQSLQGPNLETIQSFSPKVAQQALSGGEAQALTSLMLSAEQHALGGAAAPPFAIASKTGTAEHGVDPANTPPYTWYIAFAPEHDVAVAVMLEKGPNITVNTVGATYAGPIGRTMLEAAIFSQ